MAHSFLCSIAAMFLVVQLPYQEPTFRPVASIPSVQRVIGGRECNVATYPFVVSIMNSQREPTADETFGGTLIRPNWVLSAARVCPKRPKRWQLHCVQAGSSKSERHKGENPQVICVDKAYFHDEYIRNDLVLVRLKEAFELNSMVALAKLPRVPTSSSADVCSAASEIAAVTMGWGEVENVTISDDIRKVKPSETLRCVEMAVVSEMVCKNVYEDTVVLGKVICLNAKEKSVGMCTGDAGGPVVCKDAPNTVIGVVSRGADCGEGGPLVVTKVDAYLDWINSTISNGSRRVLAVKFLFVLSALINLF